MWGRVADKRWQENANNWVSANENRTRSDDSQTEF